MISSNKPEHKSETESGYVIAMTALLLVPMIVLAAFAVDVGSWYADSARIQRAADAAALAAVVYMPSEKTAHIKALEVAAQNGFVSDVDEDGNLVPGGNSTLIFVGDGAAVNIRIEYDGELFFSKVFLSDVELARTSSAEFIEPVRMGNPTSGLGTGNLTDASDVGSQGNDGFWLAMNHPCYPMQHGDPFVRYYFRPGEYTGSDACAQGNRNEIPQGQLPVPQGGGFDGYVFVVDMPATATSAELEIRNPGECSDENRNNQPDLTARLYAPDDTLLIASDNLAAAPVIPPQTWDANTTDAPGTCGWQHIATLPPPSATTGLRQIWYLKIRADLLPNDSDARGINYFSLRVRPTATVGLCNSTTAPSCPNIYALDWLPIYRPTFASAGPNAQFFLANVPEYHADKTLELTLFDPGEGMQEIQILDPYGTARNFLFREADNTVFEINDHDLGDGSWGPADTSCDAGASYCLDVTSSKYQGRTVQLKVDLGGYTCQPVGAGQNCWWQVRYISGGGGVNDRTTWKVRIIGDPIRLTE